MGVSNYEGENDITASNFPFVCLNHHYLLLVIDHIVFWPPAKISIHHLLGLFLGSNNDECCSIIRNCCSGCHFHDEQVEYDEVFFSHSKKGAIKCESLGVPSP